MSDYCQGDQDPRIASLTSVTAVELSRDLRHATVYVSIYGSAAEKERTMETLLRAAGFIRSEIGRRIRLRYAPEIYFAEDRSLEYGAHRQCFKIIAEGQS